MTKSISIDYLAHPPAGWFALDVLRAEDRKWDARYAIAPEWLMRRLGRKKNQNLATSVPPPTPKAPT
jgi:hypothetical protein